MISRTNCENFINILSVLLARMIVLVRSSQSGQKNSQPVPFGRARLAWQSSALHSFFSQQFLCDGQRAADLLRECKGRHAGPQGPGLQCSRRPVGQRGAVKACPQGDPPPAQQLSQLLAVPVLHPEGQHA